jgi:hypothetical protein
MQARVVLAVLTIGILALPITAAAQEATLTGQVADSTGAVLPGVVVRAVHEATGTTTEVRNWLALRRSRGPDCRCRSARKSW